MTESSVTGKKMAASIVVVVILSICLCITTFALVWSIVAVDNNLFHTGSVKIDLNGGKPVIEEHEFLFEPGMTVEKEFFLENKSTWDVWYRLYFKNIKGGLADVLEVTLREGDTVLYSDKLSKMTRERSAAADMLGLNEKKTLTISFHFPKTAENEAQGLSLRFDLAAEAVQTKNNPNRLFE